MAVYFNYSDKLHDSCGIAGSFASRGTNVTNVVIEMGKALQHRGQNGGGIAVKGFGKTMKIYKKAKAFNEIFRSVDLLKENSLQGEITIAHLRYPTEGANRQNCDAQPFYALYKGWELALGHNGSIVDIKKHKRKLRKFQIKLESDSDSEILTWLIVTAEGNSWRQKIANALSDVRGAYSLVMVTGDNKLMALRDPWGVRPLIWTQDNGHVFVASETCALDRISIRHSQKLKPGQLLVADLDGVIISDYIAVQKQSFCVFEKLYFSNETSVWDGVIGENRESLGQELANEEFERIEKDSFNISKIDYVVAVPDTARPGASAFYQTLAKKFPKYKLKYFRGLVKERYDWAKRTFIEDDPFLRNRQIEKKFFVSPTIVGKAIYLVDDTAVRLNTYSILVEYLHRIGVREIHCRFLAPKFLNPCFLGVNIGSRNELGAIEFDKNRNFKTLSENQLKKKLKVSSFFYLSIKGLAKSLGMTVDQMHSSHCTGCLDYYYPFDMRSYDRDFSKTAYVHKHAQQKPAKISRHIVASTIP
ncbi:hypothetical protein A3A48_03405 [Candidatus Curtissbacteria bacterium RIFCSPLOWO2_01_FULL_37_9]|uniref:Amidophosphoribosyltransferase n=1 Tax=Candidatus Curtissbacteria bacterium RIFCSPLOWO2_01_FULL_37_9 TaxID=1797724 RepID=A0A1F5GSS1_9BACT|nr:MAG: hypothetical protein A3A48_03405 [Candidatus Curtissbacteria bacterium RIFCSPLOWO2_01_FULL_37_9]